MHIYIHTYNSMLRVDLVMYVFVVYLIIVYPRGPGVLEEIGWPRRREYNTC